ncbi:unnamed protein product [Tilletia controversa]|uniref:Uncharacterized protein n=1 Tax=Tilletia controversa TaxID=13291 RepID=A0A8X7SVN2_9BASI|nr:hypothetical protein A4X06_0g5977 [Tilletia controversa]CAD6945110.1 unnamed protein product [Tilletia controversa]
MCLGDAFETALEQVSLRAKLQDQTGENLNPSSPILPEERQNGHPQAPALKGKEKAGRKRKRSKNKMSKAKKGHGHTPPTSGNDSSTSSAGSSSSFTSCSLESDSDSNSGSKTTDSDSSSEFSETSGHDWKSGRANEERYRELKIPLHIAKKVHAGEYVDLWWFTPAAASMPRTAQRNARQSHHHGKQYAQGDDSRAPKSFVEDWQLPHSEFLYAISFFLETMGDEFVEKRTTKASWKLNMTIRTHRDRHDPMIQEGLQRLHHHHSQCFAHTSRRVKNKRK